MFGYASAFNQPVGDWDVSKVTNMEYMFTEAKAFDQVLCGQAWVNSQANKDYMFNHKYSVGPSKIDSKCGVCG